ncbi:MAG: alpha/beta fold hydrolase [Halioglobus sp.]
MTQSTTQAGAPAGSTAMQWHVNGLELHGLAWGDPSHTPVLALHGWLDNAASYAFLAPQMHGCYVVAPDLTGHGLSDNRSADSSYQIWDDLPELMGITEALGWESFSLLGHSRGAIISMLLASAIPERVRSLALLDGVVPPPIDESDFPAQMRKALDDKALLLNRPSRAYESIDLALAVRLRKGLSHAAAEAIVGRNLTEDTDGFRWRTDPRLQGASAMKLTAGQSRAAMKALDMPVLLLLAEETLYRAQGLEELVAENIRTITVEQVPGHHHFHMEEGCEKVADRLGAFIGAAMEEGNA